MSGFAELGLSAALDAATAAVGYDQPTPIQRAAIPVLRRGGNAAVVASSGSGVTAAWGLALLDRLAASETAPPPSDPADTLRPRALVLTATEERASAVARTIGRLSAGLDVPVRALTVEWSARGGDGILVAPIGGAARAIRSSSLKLDRLDAIVFEQVPLLADLEKPAVFEALGAAMPAGAQRIVVTADWSKNTQRFVEANARRALTIPARMADPADIVPAERVGSISYIATTSAGKADALARVLRRSRAVVPLVSVRSKRRAADVIAELAIRGFKAAAEPAPGLDAVVSPQTDLAGAPLIACDVPVDAAALRAMNLEDGLVLVEPSELAHLRATAAEAGIALEPIGGRQTRGSAAAYRENVKKALEEEDLDAQIALLDPLFDSHSAIEVAAALSALLRDRHQAEAAAPPKPELSVGRPPAFVRLFVSAGTRDNIRAGDLVGAITGESGVKGEQIGKIELRDTFSVVEVAADVADRVIAALNGTTLRGRSMRVDFDRKGASPPARPSRPAPRAPRH